MATSTEGDSTEAASVMPAAQLSAMEAELKEKYGDDVPSAIQDAIVEAVKSLKIAMEQATPTPNTGSLSSPTEDTTSTGLPLPAELRNRIYELCIEPLDKEIEIHWRYPVRFSPLTQVCRQLRYDTLSYYRNCNFIKFCTCMRRSERMNRFFQGPGKTLIPHANFFNIQTATCELQLDVPRPSDPIEEAPMAYASGRRLCSKETAQGDSARSRIIRKFEDLLHRILEERLQKREDGKYWMPVQLFKQICVLFRRWNDENFAD